VFAVAIKYSYSTYCIQRTGSKARLHVSYATFTVKNSLSLFSFIVLRAFSQDILIYTGLRVSIVDGRWECPGGTHGRELNEERNFFSSNLC